MNQIALEENNSFYYRFFRLTAINMTSSIIVPLAGLVSIAFLGHLSEIRHLAGVALAASILDCIYFIFNFLRMSTSGITAQSVGRGDREEMLLVLIRNSLIALGLSLAVLILQSQAWSQYLMLLVGLILCFRVISWPELGSLVHKIWDSSALKSAFSLNGNLFVYVLAHVLAFVFCYQEGAAMGTITLTENALMFQILLLAAYANDGIALATEALAGNFQGGGKIDSLLPLVRVALITSVSMALSFALVTVLFPQTVFGLLTDHTEVTETIDNYVNWLFLVLTFSGVSTVFKGYFVGLTEGKILRNASLVSTIVGFAPVSLAAWYFQSNHLLWLALSMFFVIRTIMFGIELPRTLRL